MSDETQTKSVTKTAKTVSVITLIPVYPAAGKAPYPIGTKLNVSPERASFWTSRGIARPESAGSEEVNRVGSSADNSVEAAPLPAAPPMTPLPKQPGA
ncbi:hypothetical protein FOH24_07040 [Acetobacter tropicalis]|uniref:Uncharacterized protein n=1 Tax=Acetobacter tropicalis TaxID=104102 RepID=A0A094YGL0_9PROT|nr:hypothetical protein [Acetobacter tropicalis]KAA8387044.1 hypothetical protein FOH22_10385 [Acetobacter tropicalis]KAA8391389.1 hypothetical protein FOH24_07040 [Acetobacter tropicalis]KGB21165.1 hypothetical protein AtDm6_3160 [Acetobacter tropicalis]MBC9008788.1 hypothetical protein [Acetobacter tropicalis]MDO8171961.1 hypothetical protein [Acetobacter tropicalis]